MFHYEIADRAPADHPHHASQTSDITPSRSNISHQSSRTTSGSSSRVALNCEFRVFASTTSLRSLKLTKVDLISFGLNSYSTLYTNGESDPEDHFGGNTLALRDKDGVHIGHESHLGWLNDGELAVLGAKSNPCKGTDERPRR